MEGSDGEYLIMKRLNVGKQETESQRVIGNNAESSVKNQDSRANNAESSINNGESGINNADSRANVS